MIDLVIFEVKLHFQCYKPKVVGLISTKWLLPYWYGLLQSLITGILVNDAKYIHFYPTFQLPQTLSHCKCKPFVKSIEFAYFATKFE